MNQHFLHNGDENSDDLEQRLAAISLLPPSADYQQIPSRLGKSTAARTWTWRHWLPASALVTALAVALLLAIPSGEEPVQLAAESVFDAQTAGPAIPSAAAEAEPRFVEGTHYVALREPLDLSDSTTTQVVAFFWYPCWPCAEFEEFLTAWEAGLGEDVTLTRVPAIWSESMRFHARAYYTAQALGVGDRAHLTLFTAFHRDNPTVSDELELQQYFLELGVSATEFLAAYNAESTLERLAQAERQNFDYQIQSTPSLFVSGRYAVSPTTAGGHPQMLEVVDYLIEN